MEFFFIFTGLLLNPLLTGTPMMGAFPNIVDLDKMQNIILLSESVLLAKTKPIFKIRNTTYLKL